jgi:hypothetical protein
MGCADALEDIALDFGLGAIKAVFSDTEIIDFVEMLVYCQFL